MESTEGFQGERVAIRPLSPDGTYALLASHQIATIDSNPKVSAMSPNTRLMSPG